MVLAMRQYSPFFTGRYKWAKVNYAIQALRNGATDIVHVETGTHIIVCAFIAHGSAGEAVEYRRFKRFYIRRPILEDNPYRECLDKASD